MTVVLAILAVVAIVVLLAAVYNLAIAYAFEETPRCDETHEVYTDDGWRIRLYRYRATSGAGEPVLIVHGLFANQFNLSSPDNHSLVDYLSRRGFDCWAIELRGCRSSRGPSGVSRYKARLEDAVSHDVPAAIAHILNETGADRLHWVGHSLGGLVYYAYEQQHGPDALLSVATIGTPPGLAHLHHSRLDLARAIWAPLTRWAPGIAEFLLRGVSPWSKPTRFESVSFPIDWNNVHAGMRSADFYSIVELATLPYLESLDRWIQDGTWRLKDGAIDVEAGLPNLKTPLLSIYGAADPLAPVIAGRKLFDSLTMRDKSILVLSVADGHSADYDHIDLAFGKHGEQEVFEPIRQWLAGHAANEMTTSGTTSAATRMLAASADTSWRRALRRAATVMNEFGHGDRAGAIDEQVSPATKKATRKAAARQTERNGKRTPKPKTRTAVKLKRKMAAKAKAKTRPATKTKPVAKTKPAARTKPAAKSKSKTSVKASANGKTHKPKAKTKTKGGAKAKR